MQVWNLLMTSCSRNKKRIGIRELGSTRNKNKGEEVNRNRANKDAVAAVARTTANYVRTTANYAFKIKKSLNRKCSK